MSVIQSVGRILAAILGLDPDKETETRLAEDYGYYMEEVLVPKVWSAERMLHLPGVGKEAVGKLEAAVGQFGAVQVECSRSVGVRNYAHALSHVLAFLQTVNEALECADADLKATSAQLPATAA